MTGGERGQIEAEQKRVLVPAEEPIGDQETGELKLPCDSK